jgi:hypothetical protein
LNVVVAHDPLSNNSFVKSAAFFTRCVAYDLPRLTLHDLRVTNLINLRFNNNVAVYEKMKNR